MVQPSWCLLVMVRPCAPEDLNSLAHAAGSKFSALNIGAKSCGRARERKAKEEGKEGRALAFVFGVCDGS